MVTYYHIIKCIFLIYCGSNLKETEIFCQTWKDTVNSSLDHIYSEREICLGTLTCGKYYQSNSRPSANNCLKNVCLH